MSTPDQQLHQSLRTFYNQSEAYFREAGEANSVLTPERAHLFSFIRDDARVLDVGCGGCENGLHLQNRTRYTGCDVSGVGLRVAAGRLNPVATRLTQAEAQSLPFADQAFDVVLSTYALEHFVFPEQVLREMWRVCRSGGRVILVSPSYDDPFLLPPSTGHWSAARRGSLIAAQALRQTIRHFLPGRWYFSRVQTPRVLNGEYQPDFDAVHLVSAREIANFFRHTGGKILFERRRSPRPASSWRDSIRNTFLRLGIGAYVGLNLQIVVEKP